MAYNPNLQAKLVSNFLLVELLGLLNNDKRDFQQWYQCHIYIRIALSQILMNRTTIGYSSLSHERFSEVVELFQKKSVTLAASKMLLSAVYNGDSRTPLEIVECNGWWLSKDVTRLETNCREIIEANQNAVSLTSPLDVDQCLVSFI